MTPIDEDSATEHQESDYDGAWKETLRTHLQESMRKAFPNLAELIDWTCEPAWLDKEISQIIGKTGRRNREVDVLFKIRLLDGRDQWVLCHLEIQTSYEPGFASRIDLYNAGLKWTFQEEVVTLVILADLHPNWRPTEHQFQLGDFCSIRRFPICKLLDHLTSDWTDDDSLVVAVARAQISALQTASHPEDRFSAKTQLVRNLYTQGFSSDKIREMFRLIDWMMRLRPDLDRRFKTELIAYEEEIHMPYVTSVERIAKEEGREEGLEVGREEGREEGSANLLLRILTRQCGPIPEDIQLRIQQLNLEQGQTLGEALLDFDSLQDLKNWFQLSPT